MSRTQYLPDMEILDSDMMERVLGAREWYAPEEYNENDVRRALANAGSVSSRDFAALLSPAARPLLEEIAAAARRETRFRFGNSVNLFTPLYMANYCENRCVYCGFNKNNDIARARLSQEEIEREMAAIASTGLEEILLLTGESPAMSPVSYIQEACRIAQKHFRVVGLEIYPVNSGDYARLKNSGADFVTVFQETYDPGVYRRMHPGGRKAVFPYRFYAQERALLGGMRGVGFAALLGLADFRRDAFATGMHAHLIQRKYPHAEIALSCPRLRPTPGNGLKGMPAPVGEAGLLQIICAYRLFLPHAAITISSRESAGFRDNAVKIAATKISAGVDVGIGGHAAREQGPQGDGQFEIDDGRTVKEINEMLLSEGMQPVMSEYLYL